MKDQNLQWKHRSSGLLQIIVMQEQLSRVFSGTLREMNGGQQQFIEGMEEHLKQKARELQFLQQCFQSEIRQMQTYERKQRVYRRVINMLLGTFGYLKNELQGIKSIWGQVRSWREQIIDSLKALPTLVNKAFESYLERRDESLVKSRVEVNQSEFKRIEMKYREQIQRQRQTILQLQSALKSKSLNNNKHSQSSFKRDFPDHIRSHDVELLGSQRISPLKQLKEARKNSNLKEKSVSPAKTRPTQKTLNKEEVVQKIRKYHQSKTIRESYNAMQKKAGQGQHKRQQFEVPSLPQLKVNLNFHSPISSGFDVLVIDGKQVYKGMWRRGKFEGRGKYYHENWIYDGEFRNGNIEGFGTLNFKGCTFIGKFENGEAQGEGTLYCKQKPISGLWKDNVLVKQF